MIHNIDEFIGNGKSSARYTRILFAPNLADDLRHTNNNEIETDLSLKKRNKQLQWLASKKFA